MHTNHIGVEQNRTPALFSACLLVDSWTARWLCTDSAWQSQRRVSCKAHKLQAKKFDKAVAIMGRNQWWDKLNLVVGQLQGQEPAEKTALAMCAAFFRRAGQTQFAKEAYVKLQYHQVKSHGSHCSQTW